MVNSAMAVILHGHLAAHKIHDSVHIFKPVSDMTLITALRHETRQICAVRHFDFAQDQIWGFDRWNSGESLHGGQSSDFEVEVKCFATFKVKIFFEPK